MDAIEQRIENREGREYFTLDRFETFYYWQHLVRKPFVLVNQKTSFGQMPRVAYFFPDPDEDELFPMMLRFHPYPRPNRVGELASNPAMHALRIELPADSLERLLPSEDKIKFTVGILQQGAIDGRTDGCVFGKWPLSMFALPTWQAKLWESFGLTIPPSREMKSALSDAKTARFTKLMDVTGDLKDINLLRLVLCMLGNYWAETNAKTSDRTWHITNLLHKQAPQALSKYEGLAGLKHPTRNQFLTELRSIVNGAAKFFAKHPDKRMDAEEWEQEPVAFGLPSLADDTTQRLQELLMKRRRTRG